MEKLCSLSWNTLVSVALKLTLITLLTNSKASDSVNGILTKNSTMQALCTPFLY